MTLKPAMWVKALAGMPKIDAATWQSLDLISRWLIATRAAVLVMTFTSAALAGLFAFKVGQFHFLPWLMMTLGLCLAHATNNLLNDLTDHWKGVDKGNYFRTQCGVQPIESGLMTMAAIPSLFKISAYFKAPPPESIEGAPEDVKKMWPLYYVAAAFWYTRRFGGIFTAALILDALFF